jgi:Zn-dependent protease with chaperone function
VEKTAYELGHDAGRFVPRWSYLLMQVRQQMLLVVPPILLLLLQQILFAFFPTWEEDSYLPAGIAIGMMAVAFVLMPILLRVFLGLKPLPAGPLRDRLESTARRLGFGYSNILVWHTRNLSANAMVTGFIPWIRYIILTDRLIDELTPDEIEAVFGHEVGHIKHHHLFFYLAFFVASIILLGLFWDTLKEWIKQDDILTTLAAIPFFGGDDTKDTIKMLSSFVKLGLLAAYTLCFFGYISRRCERQADLFGAQTVSTDVFISALEKVADINGIPRNRAGNWLLSWQHPTINQRIEFLEAMRDHPARIPRFHLTISLMQWAVYLMLGFLLWRTDLPDVQKWLAEF